MNNLDIMTNTYLATALWSSNDWDDMDDSCNPTPFDKKFDTSDFTDEAIDTAHKECQHFITKLNEVRDSNGDYLLDQALEYGDYEQLGHDFWLTRNGHGAGFWDGDYGDYGGAITKAVYDNFSKVTPFVDCDGKVGWL